MASHTKHLIFLLTAVAVADADPVATGPAVDLDKQQRLDDIVAQLHPDLSTAQRRQLVGGILRTLPPIRDGITFLRLLERSSRALNKALGGNKKHAYGVLKRMKAIAEADDFVSEQELLVLRTVAASIGLRRHVDVQLTAGELVLKRVA